MRKIVSLSLISLSFLLSSTAFLLWLSLALFMFNESNAIGTFVKPIFLWLTSDLMVLIVEPSPKAAFVLGLAALFTKIYTRLALAAIVFAGLMFMVARFVASL